MSGVKSDIEIARAAKMEPIGKILEKINVPDNSDSFSPMGRHIAKLNFGYIDKFERNSFLLSLFFQVLNWEIKGKTSIDNPNAKNG